MSEIHNCPKCNKEYKNAGKYYNDHVEKCTAVPTKGSPTNSKGSSGKTSPLKKSDEKIKASSVKGDEKIKASSVKGDEKVAKEIPKIVCHNLLTDSDIVVLQITVITYSLEEGNKGVYLVKDLNTYLTPQKAKFNQILLDLIAIFHEIKKKGTRAQTIKILSKITNIGELGIKVPTE